MYLSAVRRGRVAVIVAAAAYAAVLLAAWSTIENVNDYAGFVSGAKAVLAGESPYDPAQFATAYLRLGTQKPDTSVFGYPGWIVVAFLPLAPLPVAVGSLVWNVITFALALWATRSFARHLGIAETPALLLAGVTWPAYFVFLQGQWAYLLYALAVATFLDLSARRDARSGAWWALAVLAKPQLFVVASLALFAFCVRWRRWRVIASAAVVSLVAFAASAIVTPGWWVPWLGAVASRRLVRSTQQPTLAGVAGDIAGDAWPIAWGALILVLALAIVWAARRAPQQRTAIAFAGTLTLSVGAAVYSWSYDQYLFVAAGIVTLALAAAAPASERRWIQIATALLFGPVALGLWLSGFARFHDTGSGLMPILVVALLCGAAWRATTASRPAPREASVRTRSLPQR